MIVAIVAALWCVIALPVAVIIGRAARDPNPRPTWEDYTAAARDQWSQAAVDAEFAQMMPGFVTSPMFDLDNSLNRRARGAA